MADDLRTCQTCGYQWPRNHPQLSGHDCTFYLEAEIERLQKRTCDTCKHWESRIAHLEINYVNAGRCNRALEVMDAGDAVTRDCYIEKFDRDNPYDENRKQMGGDEMGVSSNEEMSGTLYTGPKFGCIHHEAKE